MIYFSNNLETLLFVFVYILTYNFSIVSVIWAFKQFSLKTSKTLNKLSQFKEHPLLKFFLTVLFLSMGGVPPFLGFFTKLLVLLLLTNTSFIYIYFWFTIILVLSLFFYVQNIRFLHASKNSYTPASFYLTSSRVVIVFNYYMIFVNFLLILGFFFIDDFFLYAAFFFF